MCPEAGLFFSALQTNSKHQLWCEDPSHKQDSDNYIMVPTKYHLKIMVVPA